MENEKKVNVLLVAANYDYKQILSGVDYHRIYSPYLNMERNYPRYSFTLCRSPFHLEPKDLKKIDFCIFSKDMFFENDNIDYHPKGLHDSKSIITYLQQEFNITVIMDLDDTWIMEKSNPNYQGFYNTIINGKSLKTHIIDGLLSADLVTTTTEILKKDILKVGNIDVEVIPNAIDSTNKMFSKKKTTSKDYVTFGYAKVVSQKEDLAIMEEVLPWAYEQSNFRLKFHGYDGGQHHRRVHSVLSMNENASTKQYGFLPRVPPSVYGIGYEDIDVLITPLADNHFNSCKSNLKQIECAFTDTIFLGSNVEPYASTNFGLKFNDAKGLKVFIEDILEDFEVIKEESIETSKNMYKYEMQEVNKLRDSMFKSFN